MLAILAATSAIAAAEPAPSAPQGWVRRPSQSEIWKWYPERAARLGLTGDTMAVCDVAANGGLSDCLVTRETPDGAGFGSATLALADHFFTAAPPAGEAKTISIGFHFGLNDGPKISLRQTPPPPRRLTQVDWLRRPNGDDLSDSYPENALRQGVSGRATILCVVNQRGLLQGCRVGAEDPPALGFGAAALKMSYHFEMRPLPGLADDQLPTIKIPIHFVMPGDGVAATADSNTVLNPQWRAAPTYDEVLAIWSSTVGEPATAVFDCRVQPPDGHLDDCHALLGAPERPSAARAAQPLLARFRVRIDPAWNLHGLPLRVNVPIKLIDPASAAATQRRVSQANWIGAPDAADLRDAYPAQAVAAGVAQGRGVAECAIGADGALEHCTPAGATPEGLGFDQAAVKVASGLRMNLWNRDGGAVIGATVRLPIRFIEDPANPPAAAAR